MCKAACAEGGGRFQHGKKKRLLAGAKRCRSTASRRGLPSRG
uniref:Uncharacterized protein n=1 Tax=Arundo donax TaxID=35708 RepID=A0A0A9B8J3_ARUDO